MSGAAELALRLSCLVTIAAGALTCRWAWHARHRWGSEPRSFGTFAGEGPYRRGLVRRWVPRGVPWSISLVGGAGIAWGLITSFVLAPGGLLFLLAPARHDPERQILLMLAGLGVFAAAVAGFPLGLALARASRALIERAPDARDRALTAATWSSLHHATVLLSFVLFGLHERDATLASLVAVPCALGVVHAWALTHVSRTRDRTPL
jgi:hypothetical protein